MIIMQPGATREEIDTVIETVHENSMTAYANVNQEGAIIGVVGENRSLPMDVLEALPCVKDVLAVTEPYELASRRFHPQDSVFPFCGFTIGGKEIPIIAGPCSVESREGIIASAQAVKAAGANALRGGVYKPRQSPYSFQGLGEIGLEYMAEARALTLCVNNGGRGCKISSTTKCGAMAFYTTRIRRTRYWGAYTAEGATLGQAIDAASARCRKESRSPSDCNIRASFCADGSHKG